MTPVKNSRPKRKAIPNRIKILVVIRQDGRCKCCNERLDRVDKTEFNHRPALVNRDINKEGTDYIPEQLSPDYIEALHAGCHKTRTFGTKATTAGSDIHTAAKVKRIRRKRETFSETVLGRRPGQKRKPTGRWARGRKLQSRNTFRRGKRS